MREPIILDNELESSYLEQICNIDKVAFQLEPTKHFLTIAKKTPWLYHVLRQGNNVLGYTSVLPLRKTAFNAMKTGEIWENELQFSDIDEINPEGFYLLSVAASSKVISSQQYCITGRLCGVAGGQLGRSSKPVIAVPITEKGQSVAEMLNMKPIQSNLDIKGVNNYTPKVWFKPPYLKKTPLNVGN